ncbi:hypothetical protein BDV96DRAFT_247899 [Lophiotrema nucula]|uniref:C2H2-type domain-containing protein n=1 Tax=Lophiotrema nucula TaxID=690887 RepID=A0A6A5YPE2_9PLEO|nr:hypothetical protein BDV96DRAFT_247899 [Lophiotrema nucula]
MAIAIQVAHTFDSFTRLEQCFDDPSSSPQNEDKHRLSVRDELGRFRVWAGNIGAHKKGKSSLDFRLREASYLSKNVLDLLLDLVEALCDARTIIDGSRQPWDKASTAEGSDSTGSDSGDDISWAPPTSVPFTTELDQIFLDISEIITCLMRVSMTIRQPVSYTKFAEAADVEMSHFDQYDLGHVRDKFALAEDFLIQRLAHAITIRRKYLMYRESHQQKLQRGLDDGVGDDHEGMSTVASSLPPHLRNPPGSEVEADARSDTGDSDTSFASSLNDTTQLSPPPLPKAAHTGSPFECPVCHAIIDIHDTLAWRKHVFKDLHPYMCTFAECTFPNRLFERRNEWFSHELQLHRKSWICGYGCSKTFSSRHAYESHLLKRHPSEAVKDQHSTLADIAETQMPMNSHDLCPLCKEHLTSLKLLRRHLGRHQEQLALFALPLSMKGEEGPDDESQIAEDKSIAPHADSSVDSSDEDDGDAEDKATIKSLETPVDNNEDDESTYYSSESEVYTDEGDEGDVFEFNEDEDPMETHQSQTQNLLAESRTGTDPELESVTDQQHPGSATAPTISEGTLHRPRITSLLSEAAQVETSHGGRGADVGTVRWHALPSPWKLNEKVFLLLKDGQTAGPFTIVHLHPPRDRSDKWRYDIQDQSGRVKTNISSAIILEAGEQDSLTSREEEEAESTKDGKKVVEPKIIIEFGKKKEKSNAYPSSRSQKRSSLAGSISVDDITVESPSSDASYTLRTGFPESKLSEVERVAEKDESRG